MNEAALYILTGLTLYAGGHHLYLGASRGTPAWPHLQLGGMYWLLAGFAMTSALTFQSANLAVLLPTGKMEIGFGILLWMALLWHVAWRTGFKPLVLLDLITAAWLIFLVRNLIEPNSLLYADVTPVNQTLMSGEVVDTYFTRISPWWTAVEITMAVSLAFAAYACYRLYRSGQQRLAWLLGAGAGLLGLVSLHDHLVSIQMIRAGYLAPFGFLLFLLPQSLYPLWLNWRSRNLEPSAPTIYNLTYMPDQASFHADVSQLRAPLQPAAFAGTGETAAAGTAAPAGDAKPSANAAPAHIKPEAPVPPAAAPAAPPVDTQTIGVVTDSLIDIAVFATMALNRFKRGDADPQTVESLCRKIRTRAIKTRRVLHRLLPESDGREDSDARDNDKD